MRFYSLFIASCCLDRIEEEGDNDEVEQKEPRETATENDSENIEVIDIEMEEAGAWKRQKNQFPATPIFHGGELDD